MMTTSLWKSLQHRIAHHGMNRHVTSNAAVLCWLVLAAAGAVAFWRYELTAGVEVGIPKRWPSASVLALPQDTNLLLMFVHPRCGCTSASLEELRGLLPKAKLGSQPQVVFILLQPDDTDLKWIGSHNEKLCREFPNARIHYDSYGSETHRFGVATSGNCLLYSKSGHLAFSGGVTASRGHKGPSPGQESLLEALDANAEGYREFCVFGCPMLSPQSNRTRVAISK